MARANGPTMQFQKAGNCTDQCRLAGTVRTENGDDLAFADRQVDPGQHEGLAAITR